MSYLVLARKWRPQRFEDVLAQEHVTQTLVRAIAAKRVAHAFLFAGPRGVGKTTTARLLARALNCAQGPTPEPCGKCAPCRQISEGSDLDVVEMDAATRTGVDDIRSLNDSAKTRPMASRFRIFIIDEVHMLSDSAFNALLKTLEEPPGHVKFIFATTAPQKVPATVLSRCQRYDFKRIPPRTIAEQLKKIAREEKIGIADRAAFMLAREADGSMRDAESLLDQARVFCGSKKIEEEDIRKALGIADRKLLLDVGRALVERNGASCLEAVEEIHSHGYDIPRFCEALVGLLRDLTVVRLFPDSSLLGHLAEDEIEEIAELARKRSAEDLQRMFSLMSRGTEEIARSSFPRVVLEMTLLKMIAMPAGEPVGELIVRLEELEKRISAGGSGGSGGGSLGPVMRGGTAEVSGSDSSCEKATKEGIADRRPFHPPRFAAEGRREAEVFLGEVKRADKGLALIVGACDIGVSAGGVVSIRACSRPHFEQLNEPGRREKLEMLACRALGREAVVYVLEPSSSAKKEQREKKEAERERMRAAAESAREHPAVKAALAVLGGDISEINVGKGPQR